LQLLPPVEASGEIVPYQLNRLIFFTR